MANINNALSTFTRNTIFSYQKLAEKVVNDNKNSQTGVVAALERFFHKLEFLLKFGYFPTQKDASGDRLPSELQGLKAFLKNGKTGDSYVLQRNETERYCFIKQDKGKLTVTVEKFHASIVAVRSGYNNISTEEWHVYTAPQECGVSELLSLLKGIPYEILQYIPYDTLQYIPYEEFCAKYNADYPLPISSNQHPVSINNDINRDDCVNAYRKSMEKISDKPYSYFIPASDSENTSSFNTCLLDIRRSDDIPLSLGGVKIPESMFKEIISRIMSGYETEKSSVVNTSAFASADVERMLSSCDINPDEKKAISNILQHPQFPLALLAVVCQGLSGGGVMDSLLLHQSRVVNYLQDNHINCIKTCDLTSRSFSIKSDEKGGLLCENTTYMPCLVDRNKIGVSKACNMFFVTEKLGTGNAEHSESDVKNMLATLTPGVFTTITI